jgi:hypothetical protein
MQPLRTRGYLLVGEPDGRPLQVLRKDAIVAVDLRVAEVGHHCALEAAYLSLLVELPGAQLVLGVLDDVLQGEAEHGRVFDLLEVEEEGHLSFESLAC